MPNVWGGLMEIAMALLALAFFALVLNPKSNTQGVVQTTSNSFGNLLDIVTLQSGGYGSNLGGMPSFNSGLVN